MRPGGKSTKLYKSDSGLEGGSSKGVGRRRRWASGECGSSGGGSSKGGGITTGGSGAWDVFCGVGDWFGGGERILGFSSM